MRWAVSPEKIILTLPFINKPKLTQLMAQANKLKNKSNMMILSKL